MHIGIFGTKFKCRDMKIEEKSKLTNLEFSLNFEVPHSLFETDMCFFMYAWLPKLQRIKLINRGDGMSPPR